MFSNLVNYFKEFPKNYKLLLFLPILLFYICKFKTFKLDNPLKPSLKLIILNSSYPKELLHNFIYKFLNLHNYFKPFFSYSIFW